MSERIVPAGDRALLVQLGDRIDPALHDRVLRLYASLQAEPPPGVEEVVPGYASVLVYYDPLATRPAALAGQLRRRLEALPALPLPPAALVELPVCYGGEFGPDLPEVARRTGLAPEEVVRRHAAPTYRVYCLGFLPGFAYLGGLDPLLAVPRRDTPRVRVPAGAVGIGGRQTGVYPVASPGGWHLIGRTPARLYLPERTPPCLLRPGDRVRFVPVSPEEFHALAAAAERGWLPPRREVADG